MIRYVKKELIRVFTKHELMYISTEVDWLKTIRHYERCANVACIDYNNMYTQCLDTSTSNSISEADYRLAISEEIFKDIIAQGGTVYEYKARVMHNTSFARWGLSVMIPILNVDPHLGYTFAYNSVKSQYREHTITWSDEINIAVKDNICTDKMEVFKYISRENNLNCEFERQLPELTKWFFNGNVDEMVKNISNITMIHEDDIEDTLQDISNDAMYDYEIPKIVKESIDWRKMEYKLTEMRALFFHGGHFFYYNKTEVWE